MKKSKRYAKIAAAVVLTPIALFLLLAILIYTPPVQRFAVRQAAEMLSESTGLNVSVGEVRLAFPLDLNLGNVLATDAEKDTILDARELYLDVALLPLFEGRADVDGFRLSHTKINTKGLIADVQISGNVGSLTAASHGIAWEKGDVPLEDLKLKRADLYIQLADTAKEDTVKTPSKWVIDFKKAEIEQSNLLLSLPQGARHIGLTMHRATLTDGLIHLPKKKYTFGSVDLKKSGVYYDVAQTADAPEPLARLRRRYAGKAPVRLKTKDIDLDHLHLTDFTGKVDSISYDSLGTLHADVRQAMFRERSGLDVRSLKGKIDLTDERFTASRLHLATPASTLDGRVAVGLKGAMRLDVKMKGTVGAKDMGIASALFFDKAIRRNYPNRPLKMDVEVVGTMSRLRLPHFDAAMPGVFKASGSGMLRNVDKAVRSGDFNVDATAYDARPLLRMFAPDLLGKVNVPSGTRAKGRIGFGGTRYSGDLTIASGGGTAKIVGAVDTKTERYTANVKARQFPLQRFLPAYTGSSFTGETVLRGQGFDVLSSKAYLDGKLKIGSLSYAGYDLSNITFDGRVTGSSAKGLFSIDNPLMAGKGYIDLQIQKEIKMALNARFDRIDLQRLGASEKKMTLGGDFNLQAHTNRQFTAYGVSGTVKNPHLMGDDLGTTIDDVAFNFETGSTFANGIVRSGDLYTVIDAKSSLPRVLERLNRFQRKFQEQVVHGRVVQKIMQRELPEADLLLRMGRNNPLASLARLQGYDWESVYLKTSLHPASGVNGDMAVSGVKVQELRIDSADARIMTDTAGLKVLANVNNYKKDNPNRFSATTEGYLLDDGFGGNILFKDKNGKTGARLGAESRFYQGGMRFHVSSDDPVIAYRKFDINPDNFIFIDKNQFISGNLRLLADDGTSIQVSGEPQDTVTDLTVSVSKLNLAELTEALPFLPKMGGFLEGDVHWRDNHRSQNAMLDVTSDDFKYDDVLLGNLNLQGIFLPKTATDYYASAFVSSNGHEALAFNGMYSTKNDGTIDGKVELDDFPAPLLNGFLAGTDVMLRGVGRGELDIKGPVTAPAVNGELLLDSASVYSKVYGFDYALSKKPLKIVGSKVNFEKYELLAGSDAPLTLNGTVDFSQLANVRYDFGIRARNFPLINAQKNTESLIYGKAFADFNGTLVGNTKLLRLRGDLDVLPTTNVAYMMKDSPLTTDDQLRGLVEFVSFDDTTAVAAVEEEATGGIKKDIVLNIHIDEDAQAHCDMSTDGKSYVDLRGGGDLTFRMTQQDDMRLTGRYVINQGEMEYELPVIPLKKFQIANGSSVNFTGDPMNPQLNIQASEKLKGLVTENDQQRSVEFTVGVEISKTLEDMGLNFTIEAPEDIGVNNELNSMSKAERNKVAIAMLATGMYLTDQSIANGTGFKANNALNAFLQNEIQQIAGNALKSVNLSVGVESGTTAAGTTTTDYSFQFSKRFMDGRLTVNIGGKISAGVNAVNNAESFIDNISLEYRLDRSSSRYVRVFYDRDTQDPLEGQLTTAGVGLVLKKKSNRLGDLFIFRRKNKEKPSE